MADETDTSSSSGVPIEIEESSKSPEDLAAEIAATAAALGGDGAPKKRKKSSKKTSKAQPKTEPEPEPEPAVESDDAAQTEKAESPPAQESDEDDDAEAITVRIEKKAEPEPEAEAGDAVSPKQESPSDEVDGERIPIRTTSTPAAAAEPDVPEEPASLSHAGKTIKPINISSQPVEATDDTASDTAAEPLPEAVAEVRVETEEPQPETPQPEPEAVSAEPPAPSETEPEPEPVPQPETAVATESQPAPSREAIKANEEAQFQNEREHAQPQKDQQSFKIYDTKKYHLPVKADKHHKKSGMPAWVAVLIILAAIAGAAAVAFSSGLTSFDLTSTIHHI